VGRYLKKIETEIVYNIIPQLNGSLLHVVLEEVPLQTDVFGLLVDQGIQGLRDGALVVVPDGVVSVIGALKIFPISWWRWSPSSVALAAK
jgi:hypothetical protein